MSQKYCYTAEMLEFMINELNKIKVEGLSNFEKIMNVVNVLNHPVQEQEGNKQEISKQV